MGDFDEVLRTLTKRIKYFIDDKEYASRSGQLMIPRVGELARFKGVGYKIVRVLWVEDCARHSDNYVAIEIEPIAGDIN